MGSQMIEQRKHFYSDQKIQGYFLTGLVMLEITLACLVWERYVRQTIYLFSTGLDKILALDFSDQQVSMQGRHRLLDLMEQWRKKEQKRNQEISVLVKRLLDCEGKKTDKAEQEIPNRTLEEYRQYADAYWRPHRLEMVNRQTGKSTSLVYSDYRFKAGLAESDFVKGALARIR